MNNKISLLLSVFISIILGFFSHYGIDNLSVFHSILFGLLSFFIMHVIISSVNSDRLHKDITEIKAKLTAERIVKSGNNFDYYWMSCFDKAIAKTYTLVSENCIEIPQSEIRRFWQMAIAYTDKKWECTHYLNNPDYVNSWAKEGFELQGFMKKKFDWDVKRLFIFDKKEDIVKEVLEQIEWQQSLGIEIKILILERNQKWTNHRILQSILGTIDMAIVDNTYLMSFVPKKNTICKNKQLNLNHINFEAEREKVKKVQEIYSDMWSSSITIESLKKDVLEIKETCL